MRKANYFAACLVCFSILMSFALSTFASLQNSHWIWNDGNNTVNSPSSIQVKKAGDKQFPGARHGATAWTDEYNRVWMFGGNGYGVKVSNKATKSLDELWIFNPSKKKWTFIGGVDAVSNKSWPSACVDCVSCSHSDMAVIFGGVVKNKRRPKFHTWALNMTSKNWVMLNQTAPPAREKSAYWCDNKEGVLWLYGGVYSSKDLDDMWQFSFKTMNWTKITAPQLNSTTPKARFAPATWLQYPNKLYLFGGQSILGLMSDLWLYDATQGTWEVIKGSNKVLQKGIYGKKGIYGNLLLPGCREEALSWTDSEGDLWLFGGRGCDAHTSNASTIGLLSDVWMFNTSSCLWIWISGPSKKNGKAVYGQKGLRDTKNVAGPREDSLTFRQGDNLWIFGGIGQDKDGREGLLNDMWAYSIAKRPTLGPPSHDKGLPGDTLDMPYAHRVMIAFGILTVAMVISLLVCYRKECNIMYWRYKKKVPRVKYEPLKVRMQVPDV